MENDFKSLLASLRDPKKAEQLEDFLEGVSGSKSKVVVRDGKVTDIKSLAPGLFEFSKLQENHPLESFFTPQAITILGLSLHDEDIDTADKLIDRIVDVAVSPENELSVSLVASASVAYSLLAACSSVLLNFLKGVVSGEYRAYTAEDDVSGH